MSEKMSNQGEASFPEERVLAGLHDDSLLRQIIDACPSPISVSRLSDNVILFESDAVDRLFREIKPATRTTGLNRWVNADDQQLFLDQIKETHSVDGLEYRFRKHDKEEFWGALSARVLEFHGEEVIIVSLFDLTERRSAEAEIERQRAMLHQTEKLSALGELLAGISHELNNPLSVLVGQALILKNKASDEATIKRAERISKAAERCSRIVKSFLALAHQKPNEPVATDVNAVIEEALEMTFHLMRTSSIDVNIRLAEDAPRVMADPDQIRQVITNLIINARHALEENDGERTLTIKTAFRGARNRLVIKVTDNGPGISSDISSRIFEPLFTTKEVGKGTGIGLALCHRIVQAHNGTLKLEASSKGRTTVAIGLPCIDGSQVREPGQRWVKENADKLEILVVGDDPALRDMFADIFTTDGHGVEIQESDYIGLERLKQQKYDTVFYDARLPGMDVHGFFRSMEDARPGSGDRLAFVVDQSMPRHDMDMLDATGRPFVQFPFRHEELRELIDLLMRR